MLDRSVKQYTTKELESLSDLLLLELAEKRGLSIIEYTSKVGGKHVIYRNEQRQALIVELVKRNPSASEVMNNKLQRINRVYLLWAILASVVTVFLSVYNIFYLKPSPLVTLDSNILMLHHSCNGNGEVGGYALFDVGELSLENLLFTDGFELCGKIAKHDERNYYVDISNSIYYSDMPLFPIPKGRVLLK